MVSRYVDGLEIEVGAQTMTQDRRAAEYHTKLKGETPWEPD